MSETVGIVQQRFERAQTENLVQNLLGKALPFLQVHGGRFADHQAFQNLGHFAADVFALDFGQTIQIQFLNQPAVNRRFYRGEIGAGRGYGSREDMYAYLLLWVEKKLLSPPRLSARVRAARVRPAAWPAADSCCRGRCCGFPSVARPDSPPCWPCGNRWAGTRTPDA